MVLTPKGNNNQRNLNKNFKHENGTNQENHKQISRFSGAVQLKPDKDEVLVCMLPSQIRRHTVNSNN